MRTPRIYHPQPLSTATSVLLSRSAATHVARVLRLAEGDSLTLFDGCGGEYECTIANIDRRIVEVAIGEHRSIEVESPLSITLAQSISKGERMDYTIQKAVELGISRIVPLDSERSVVNLKGDRLEKKMQHWQGVIVSACEQCGRNTLPELLPRQTFQNWLKQPTAGIGLILDHRTDNTVTTLKKTSDVILLIGPEGGFSDRERECAYAAGYHGLRLGPRVLRTETAALTALAALQSSWGDLA